MKVGLSSWYSNGPKVKKVYCIENSVLLLLKPWCINWINSRDHFSPHSTTVGCCWDEIEGAFERQMLHS